jgi:hypothetical protein
VTTLVGVQDLLGHRANCGNERRAPGKRPRTS